MGFCDGQKGTGATMPPGELHGPQVGERLLIEKSGTIPLLCRGTLGRKIGGHLPGELGTSSGCWRSPDLSPQVPAAAARGHRCRSGMSNGEGFEEERLSRGRVGRWVPLAGNRRL